MNISEMFGHAPLDRTQRDAVVDAASAILLAVPKMAGKGHVPIPVSKLEAVHLLEWTNVEFSWLPAENGNCGQTLLLSIPVETVYGGPPAEPEVPTLRALKDQAAEIDVLVFHDTRGRSYNVRGPAAKTAPIGRGYYHNRHSFTYGQHGDYASKDEAKLAVARYLERLRDV